MDLVTLANQVDHIFLIVVFMIVVNISWALLIMIVMKRLRILEDITGIGSKIKTKGKREEINS